jgi:6-phosphogluconolactonase/glucosamine-6-phosphate isomerase/deaminase
MKLIACEGPESFVRLASEWCQTEIQRHHAHSIYIPAGQTPEILYRDWELKCPEYLSKIMLVQIDDVLNGENSRIFQKFFHTHLPSYLNNFCTIDGASTVAELGILGLGLNGHVAFHEPEVALDFFSGCVRLSETTCASLGLRSGTWGVTYGLAAFMQTRALLLMVRGQSKRLVLQRLLAGDKSLPASYLLRHPGLTILADLEALGQETN